MHQLLAEQYVASIKRRASQGDCPTEAPLSVEALEDLALTLDALSTIPEQGVPPYKDLPLDEQVAFLEYCLQTTRAWCGVWKRKAEALAPSQPAAVGVTDEMVNAAHRLYTDKVREYDRDFNSDTERAQWRAKYGSNLHSTSRGERWAMKQALEAALRSTP